MDMAVVVVINRDNFSRMGGIDSNRDQVMEGIPAGIREEEGIPAGIREEEGIPAGIREEEGIPARIKEGVIGNNVCVINNYVVFFVKLVL
jgi:hypothetical protein